ncbi:hypothetical protein SEA_HEXBUG_66 [Gordonia phage Hexbug]|nr:hypothetical protein SEA_ORLA_67 [Gordonia phage Orla]UVK62978.1 hypothetical protein SEA_HEXBUG_66 [Gordonia phage Hexbug]WNN96157.1 hypothetical protein SEA_NODIGI_66 [Gordonia phage Nodigi]
MDNELKHVEVTRSAAKAVAVDMGLQGFPYTLFADRLLALLGAQGWMLSQHDAPMTPQTEGAIELGHIRSVLMEQGGFNEEQSFTLVRDMFLHGVLGVTGRG